MSATFIKWNRNGLCGAACAHMAMHAFSISGATQGDKPEQEAIWTSIKSNTSGGTGPPCTTTIYEPFNNMIHDVCPDGIKVVCWETYPTSLRDTLLDFMGRGAKVQLRKTASETTANNIIKKCLKRGGVPIVLIGKGSHWVVVSGWTGTSSATAISYLDPAGDGPSTVALWFWNFVVMAANECGAYDKKYVVVEVEP
jgi:hypothetical protein